MAEPFVRISHPGIDGEAIVALSSVPGHAARGWVVLDSIDGSPGAAVEAAPQLVRPAANASLDAWRTYAVAAYVLGAANGLTYEQAMTAHRAELVKHFADQPELDPDNAAPGDPTSQES